jgi:hypothetical protein
MNTFTDEFPVDLLQRVRGEFAEMPGLRLTPIQAARLLGLEEALGEKVMQALVRVDFLCHTSNGVFARRSDVVR